MGKGLKVNMNYVNFVLLVVVLILVVVCCVKKPTEGLMSPWPQDVHSRLTECQEKRDLCWKNKKAADDTIEELKKDLGALGQGGAYDGGGQRVEGDRENDGEKRVGELGALEELRRTVI